VAATTPHLQGPAGTGIDYATLKIRAVQAFGLVWEWYEGKSCIIHFMYLEPIRDPVCGHAVIRANAAVEVRRFETRQMEMGDGGGEDAVAAAGLDPDCNSELECSMQ